MTMGKMHFDTDKMIRELDAKRPEALAQALARQSDAEGRATGIPGGAA